jgi:hypothetical protein
MSKNLLEAIKDLRENEIGNFIAEINFNHDKPLEIKGNFLESGPSIYADCDSFGLIAGGPCQESCRPFCSNCLCQAAFDFPRTTSA